jgi:hypothetical protein
MSKNAALQLSALSFAVVWSTSTWLWGSPEVITVPLISLFGVMGGMGYYGVLRAWHLWPRRTAHP